MQTNHKLIEFQNVSKEFIVQDGTTVVLSDLSFTIEKGSFNIIYGPSGSGKSTILNIILGLLPPTTGKVLVDGVDIYKLNNNDRALFRAKHFGIIAQNNNWVMSLNTLENVALPLFLKGETYNEALRKASDSIRRIGLEDYIHYHPSLLSVGQQQRISVARATVETPMLLVGDEPTGSLDSKNGNAIMDLIGKYKQEYDSTIIIVTHNMDYLPLSDNRIFIKDGSIKQYNGKFSKDSKEGKKIIEEIVGK